ncbi:unnamed protein product [Protopolystoma xenopodis]|uniref:Uncharacterized protein n=1 Tax=Protopolystoma xenopodis TaxID=117903 RepID=A0A448WC25_9PLAT|nr:unnamed protein product [Protopolystoma xenopodis]
MNLLHKNYFYLLTHIALYSISVKLGSPRSLRPGFQVAELLSARQAWLNSLPVAAWALSPARTFRVMSRLASDHQKAWLRAGWAARSSQHRITPTGPPSSTQPKTLRTNVSLCEGVQPDRVTWGGLGGRFRRSSIFSGRQQQNYSQTPNERQDAGLGWLMENVLIFQLGDLQLSRVFSLPATKTHRPQVADPSWAGTLSESVKVGTFTNSWGLTFPFALSSGLIWRAMSPVYGNYAALSAHEMF